MYINADTLLEKYDYFRREKEALQRREREADASLKARGRALENEAMELAKKAQGGGMTPKEMQEADQRLMAKQQKLMQEQEGIAKELMQSGEKLNERLQETLKSKLDALKDAHGYHYILSYGIGSPVLAVDSTLDITGEVLDQLNREGLEEEK